MELSPAEALYRSLAQRTASRILLLVMDGVGDLPDDSGRTPLSAGHTPNLDRLATDGVLGQLDPVLPGVTPGSGPGHLGLFGYDPIHVRIGRGLLSALGIGFPLKPGDVAARANLCTLDEAGRVVDRRAGRPSTGYNRQLVARLNEAIGEHDGVRVMFETVSEHRLLVVLRGEGLGARVSDTDPQATGVPPQPPEGADEASGRTAQLVVGLDQRIRQLLAAEERAHGLLFRGFEGYLELPSLTERFGLSPAAVAKYPMYRGLAKLAGMAVVDPPETLEQYPVAAAAAVGGRDFVFIHFKGPDKAGEDGSFDQKLAAVEAVDRVLPPILELGWEAVAVTGDHSTPWAMAAHSWHPSPVLLWGKHVRRDDGAAFSEAACVGGGMGRLSMRYLMPLCLATAGKLRKFGA